ncbi:hypothetical protein EPN81_02905 [Patescibacteria group bacterium]|nr:MAG: hypothetical protein EPN81_02905 [Patescibacteria group bacterium]
MTLMGLRHDSGQRVLPNRRSAKESSVPMPKYNLYRVPLENKDGLVDKLLAADMEKVSSITDGAWNLDFFLSRKPKGTKIGWVDIFIKHLGDVAPAPENLIHFGTFLIFNESVCYAVSLGKTHFYLRPYCDTDFGLQLAERIVDQGNLKTKHSKMFGGKKNKVITTYQKGAAIDYGSGESMHFLRAKTIDADAWGKVASFGHSVLLNLEIEPDDLPELVERIEETLLKEPVLRLPKVMRIRDEATQKDLDKKLIDAILKPAEDADLTENDVSLSGVEFIFSEQFEYTFYMKKGARDSSSSHELSLDRLRSFLSGNGIDLRTSLEDLRIEVKGDYRKPWSVGLKDVLDFIAPESKRCLIDGKWHEFNQSYLDYLQEKVDEIAPVFQSDVTGDEPTFNVAMSTEGYVNCDRDLTVLDKKYRIEAADLLKDETLFFVKFGDPRKMNYVVDQSVAAMRILKQHKKKLKIAGSDQKVKKICLWFVLDDRAKRIERLSELNSLILHMKLVDWKREVHDAGFEPMLHISWRKS